MVEDGAESFACHCWKRGCKVLRGIDDVGQEEWLFLKCCSLPELLITLVWGNAEAAFDREPTSRHVATKGVGLRTAR